MAFTGMGGNISIGGNVYGVEQWALNKKNELQDITTTASSGSVERIASVSDADLTVSFYPAGANIAALVAAIDAGVTMACVLNVGPAIGGTQAAWTGNFLSSSVNTENNPKTPVKLSLSASSSGPVEFAVG